MTRLRQQTVERDSVGVMSDYKHKNKQAIVHIHAPFFMPQT